MSTMDVYQHDSPAMFRFVVLGAIEGASVSELEHAWTTAISVLKGKDLVMDISAVTSVDQAGLALLHRMRDSGMHMTSPAPPASPDLARSLGIPAAPVRRLMRQRPTLRLIRWLERLAGLSG